MRTHVFYALIMPSPSDTRVTPALTAETGAARTDAAHQDLQDAPLLGGVQFSSLRNRDGLVWSLWDGVLGTGMIALVETFAVAAAVRLKAPAMAIAMLGSIPMLLGSMLQLIVPHVINGERGRRYYVFRAVVLQGVFIILAGLTGYLAPHYAVGAFLIAFVLYGSSGTAVSNLWMSWMADLVPRDVRGRVFAWRGRIFSAVQLGFSLSAGFLARRYNTETAPWPLFTIVFSVAGCLRLASSYCLYRQHEPRRDLRLDDDRPITLTREFRIYLVAAAFMIGTTALAGPFFTVWFLRDLQFDYFSLAVATSATVAGSIASLRWWGKLADSRGCGRVMNSAALLVAIVPLPYLIFEKPWQIWILQAFVGFAWSGYNISSFNFMLSAAGSDRPEKAISYATAAAGVSVFLFGLLGGWLAPILPNYFGWQLRSVFALSSVLRLIGVFAIFRLLGKIELPPTADMMDLFNQLPGYRQGMGILRSTFRAFRRQ